MARQITETPFARWLDQQLTSRHIGVRTLARAINPDDPEVARRALNRYLFDGAQPTNGYRQQIAQALQVDVAELPDYDEAAA